jgi:UPF0755 protein
MDTQNLLKNILKILMLLVSVTILAIAYFIQTLYFQPLIPQDKPAALFQLNAATSAYQFTKALQSAQYISSTKPLRFLIRFMGATNTLKAGIYKINPGESAVAFLKRVIAGDVLIEKFTIIAGTTEAVISTRLMQAPYLHYQASDWSSVRGSHKTAEGLLLADTYHYPANASGSIILSRAHQALMAYLDKSWATRAPNLPYETPYDLLIAASIVEKETALAQERKIIAGVLVNRLNKKMPLQMDPTVIYGLGNQYQGKLSHQNMQDPSPFNTYKNRGLPPTPIAMVGRDAIDAVAHPEITPYYYFVAKGDGSHYFSTKYEDQKRAIKRYMRKE